MNDVGLLNFIGAVVTILTDREIDNQTIAFRGVLMDFDDNFIFLDRRMGDLIDTAISIRNIIAIELEEDTPEIDDINNKSKTDEIKEKLERSLKLLGFGGDDEDDEGPIQ